MNNPAHVDTTNSERRALGYAIAAVLAWSTVATAFKLALRSLAYYHLLFLSSVSSFVVLSVICLISGEFRQVCRIRSADVGKSLLLGFLNPFAYYLVLFKAYSLLPAQLAQPLNYSWPLVLVCLSAVIYREKISPLQYLGIVVSFFGVVLIATRGQLSSLRIEEPFGVALAVGSSLIWAVYWLLNRSDPLPGSLRMSLNFAFGSLFTGLLVWSIGEPFQLTFNPLLLSIYIGLFEMGVTFFLWGRALKRSQSSMIAHLVYFSPFISLIFIAIVLGEHILPSSFWGLVLIIGGILISKK